MAPPEAAGSEEADVAKVATAPEARFEPKLRLKFGVFFFGEKI